MMMVRSGSVTTRSGLCSVLREPAARGGGCDALLKQREIRLAFLRREASVAHCGVHGAAKILRSPDIGHYVMKDYASQTLGGLCANGAVRSKEV